MTIAVAVVLIGMSVSDDVEVKEDPRPEVGRVTWLRDVSAAHAKSKESGRPVAILFQEIPGCQTCQNFGTQVLSHPLLVEALEDEFTPLLVHNNRKGRDAETLAKYSEPSWNNPVMRFFSGEGEELTPRKDGIWNVTGIARRLIASLEAADRDVPDYLQMVAVESGSKQELATFATHCYWEGEAKLGALDGVVRTESGWQDGSEVVRVLFDPARVKYRSLVMQAQELKCASTVFAHNSDQLAAARTLVGNDADAATKEKPYRVAKASDQKYYLRNSLAGYLPLTPMQAAKINERVGLGKPFDDLLSPRQAALLKRIAEAEPGMLRGLVRPDKVAGLADYVVQLTDALK